MIDVEQAAQLLHRCRLLGSLDLLLLNRKLVERQEVERLRESEVAQFVLVASPLGLELSRVRARPGPDDAALVRFAHHAWMVGGLTLLADCGSDKSRRAAGRCARIAETCLEELGIDAKAAVARARAINNSEALAFRAGGNGRLQ